MYLQLYLTLNQPPPWDEWWWWWQPQHNGWVETLLHTYIKKVINYNRHHYYYYWHDTLIAIFTFSTQSEALCCWDFFDCSRAVLTLLCYLHLGSVIRHPSRLSYMHISWSSCIWWLAGMANVTSWHFLTWHYQKTLNNIKRQLSRTVHFLRLVFFNEFSRHNFDSAYEVLFMSGVTFRTASSR